MLISVYSPVDLLVAASTTKQTEQMFYEHFLSEQNATCLSQSKSFLLFFPNIVLLIGWWAGQMICGQHLNISKIK